jgi:hypothetical protein
MALIPNTIDFMQPDQASDISVIVTRDVKVFDNDDFIDASTGLPMKNDISPSRSKLPWYFCGLFGPFREVRLSAQSLFLDPVAAFFESFIPTRVLIVCLNLTIVGNIITDIWILFKLKGYLQVLSLLVLLLAWRFGSLVQALNQSWDFGTGFEMNPIDFRVKWLIAGYLPLLYFPPREVKFHVPLYEMYDREPWYWSDILFDFLPKLATMEFFLWVLAPVYPFFIIYYAPMLAARNWKFAARRIRQCESMMLVGFCDAVEALPQVVIQYLAYEANDLNWTEFLVSLIFSALALVKVIGSLTLNITVLAGGIWRTQERCLWSSCNLKTLVDGFIGDLLLVKEINLNYNHLAGKHDWDRFIRQFKSLEILRIVGNCMDDKSAPYLAKAIARNKTIKLLDLEHNYFEDIGAEALANGLKLNSCLEVLNLENNYIGDQGSNALFNALQDNRSLKVINLSRLNRKDNQITDLGVKALANMLSLNCVLQEVNLRNNKVGDVGAELLAEALWNNYTVRVINLKDNAITSAGANAFNTALINNKTIRKIDIETEEYYDNNLTKSHESDAGFGRKLTQRLLFGEDSPFHIDRTYSMTSGDASSYYHELTPCNEKMPMNGEVHIEMFPPLASLNRKERSRKIEAEFGRISVLPKSVDLLSLRNSMDVTDIMYGSSELQSSRTRRYSMTDLDLKLESYNSGYRHDKRSPSTESLPALYSGHSSHHSPRQYRSANLLKFRRNSHNVETSSQKTKPRLFSVPEL